MKYRGVHHYPPDTHGGERDKPDHHDRTKYPADLFSSVLLDDKKQRQDGNRQRDDKAVESRSNNLNAFHRGQHGIAGVIMPSP